jgi:hypothetical protein
MPNPLLRLGTTNQSKKAKERPVPVEPVLEDYDGDNNPYRGTQTHGVEPTSPERQYDNGRTHEREPLVYKAEKEPADPIAVRVVGEQSSERPIFRTDRYTLTASQPAQLLGWDDRRQSVKITNVSDTETVRIASNGDDLNIRGYPLDPGKDLTLSRGGQSPIYAVADADGVTVALLWETSVDG